MVEEQTEGRAADSAPALTRRGDEEKAQLLARLRRIEGQVKGLQRMVEEERYCVDVLAQVSSVQEALRGVGKQILRGHLRRCVTQALRSGDETEADRTYEELLDVVFRYTR